MYSSCVYEYFTDIKPQYLRPDTHSTLMHTLHCSKYTTNDT